MGKNKYIAYIPVVGMSILSISGYSLLRAQNKPNIIVILSDDMGYSDIGCYGGIINTPNLDRLAQNGLQYMQFYNTARSCPSRASLITGLHPHQAGMGHMTNDRGEDGYRGELNNNCVTIAEVVQSVGYETYAIGKWHLSLNRGANGSKHNWPLQRGFKHFYGTIQGAGSFYDPVTLCRGNTFITVENDPKYENKEFYYTDAIADNTCMFLDGHKKQQADKPFFMYITFTAAHWPLHVPEKYIEPYKGKFNEGWDKMRKAKYKDMVQRGIIDQRWSLSSDSSVKGWESVSNKEFETRCMEVYAGMVSNMDYNIGRIIDQLKRNGQYENTIIIYLQDNGGCAEPMERDKEPVKIRVPKGMNMSPMSSDELQTQLRPFKTRDGRPVWKGRVMPGAADTYVAYGRAWAWLSNTPFREYKHWVHEGGISTPLIVAWPAGIKNKGEKRKSPGQLMDIMATCVDIAGAEYPQNYKGNDIYPYEGQSLVSSFTKDNNGDTRYLYWEHEGNRAIRRGNWKLVYKAGRNKEDIPLSAWELYNLSDDRTETKNLANQNAEKVFELATKWEEFAKKCHVIPWPKNRE